MNRPLLVRLVIGFVNFWKDFLVGDTPELFWATLGIIAAVFGVSRELHWHAVAVVMTPLLVSGALLTSMRRVWRKK